MPITAQQLLQILPNAGLRAGVFAPVLNVAMGRYLIVGAQRVAAFIAQIGHESGQQPGRCRRRLTLCIFRIGCFRYPCGDYCRPISLESTSVLRAKRMSLTQVVASSVRGDNVHHEA